MTPSRIRKDRCADHSAPTTISENYRTEQNLNNNEARRKQKTFMTDICGGFLTDIKSTNNRRQKIVPEISESITACLTDMWTCALPVRM